MKFGKLFSTIVIALLMALSLSSCYWQAQVNANEIGVQLDDGVSISRVVGPGRYDNGGWYAGIKNVNVSPITVNWKDPDLVTSDKQPIGLELNITFHRNPVSESVSKMFSTYNSELFDNKALQNLVVSRVPNSAKSNTAKLTLDQMLTDRNEFASALSTDISAELARIGVVLDTVQVANISPDKAYMDKLSQKAQVIQDREIAAESVKTAEENLKKTKAETEIQVELARRENAVKAEQSKVYETNPYAFKLEMMDKYAQIFGNNSKVFFIPEGSNLSIIDSNGNVVPVPATQPQQ